MESLSQAATTTARRQRYPTRYRAVEAATAATASQALDAAPRIDLLFTDLVLPGGMSGVELAEEAQRRRPDLKVLLISGYTEQYMGLFQQRRQRVEWLSKPYRQSQLAIKLRALLEEATPLGSAGCRRHCSARLKTSRNP